MDSVSLRPPASSPRTRPRIALLGPCFKTGGAGTPSLRLLGPSATAPASFTLTPLVGDTAFPSRYFALSVSEPCVSLGEKHLPFAVHYQPLLLSARIDRRARVPDSYRLRAHSQTLRARRGRSGPTARSPGSGRDLAASLAATQAVAFAFVSFLY